MSATTPAATGAGADDLEGRDVRALTEYLTVLPRDADGLFSVFSEDGTEYTVDVRDGACECGDATHRGATCKHQRAAAYLTEARPLPEWVDDESAINAQLCPRGGADE